MHTTEWGVRSQHFPALDFPNIRRQFESGASEQAIDRHFRQLLLILRTPTRAAPFLAPAARQLAADVAVDTSELVAQRVRSRQSLVSRWSR
jgi:hypothetical protein